MKILISIGLILNIIGVIGLAFFVKEIAIIGGGSKPVDDKENNKKEIFYCLIVLGFILQLIGTWL